MDGANSTANICQDVGEDMDIEKIKEKFRAYETHYSTSHEQQKDIDDYYELVFDAGVPKKFPTRMPPTARNWVDNGVMHFTLDNPKSIVWPRNESAAAYEQVGIMQTFYNFWLQKDNLAIKDAAKKILLRGELFLKVNMDDVYFGRTEYKGFPISELLIKPENKLSEKEKGIVEEFKEKRLFHFPLYLTVPDPINVYASPAHNGLVPVEVIESFNMTVSEALNLCQRNNWKWDTNKKPNKLVKWLSYISSESRCFLLDDVPVLPGGVQANILGFCPYVHVPCGAGQTNWEGKPEYLYRPLLWKERDMLKLEAKLLSVADAICDRWGFPRSKVRGNRDILKLIKEIYPQGIPSDPEQILYEIKDELEFILVQGEQPPPALFQLFAMAQAYAQPPAVLGGLRQPGVYSGEFQETLLATAKPIYKAAFKNLEVGLGVAMGMGARIIEQVYKHPVQIKNFASGDEKKYIKITPEKIGGHYDCEVQLLAEPPEATDMRKTLGRTLRQSGSISHFTELTQYENMSRKEALDELAQIFAEEALREPSVRGPVSLDAMDRLGMHKERQMLEEAQARAARPIPPVPKMTTGAGGVKRQGRISPEMESIAAPHEEEIRGGLGV